MIGLSMIAVHGRRQLIFFDFPRFKELKYFSVLTENRDILRAFRTFFASVYVALYYIVLN